MHVSNGFSSHKAGNANKALSVTDLNFSLLYRWLFWTDWFSPPFIGRMGMDGSGFKKIITDDLFWPNGITADTIVDKIWWADAYLDRVE